MFNRLKRLIDWIFSYPDLRSDVDRYHRDGELPPEVIEQMRGAGSRIVILILGVIMVLVLIKILLE